MVKLTCYMVNFLFISVSVECRLQTSKGGGEGGKEQTEQTEGKMQTEDCRPGVKC